MESPPKMSHDTFMFRFPARLWRIINSCKTGSISWGPNGKTVRILRKKFEEEFLTGDEKPFKTTKYESFVRQLNHYGFKKITTPIMHDETKEEAAMLSEYHNPNFTKGNPECVAFLERRSQKHRDGSPKRRKKRGARVGTEDCPTSAEKKDRKDVKPGTFLLRSSVEGESHETSSSSETYGHQYDDYKDFRTSSVVDAQLESEREKLLSSTVKFNMMARHLAHPDRPLYSQEPLGPAYGGYSRGSGSYRSYYTRPASYEPNGFGDPLQTAWSQMPRMAGHSQLYEDYVTAHVRVPNRSVSTGAYGWITSYGSEMRPVYMARGPNERLMHHGQQVPPNQIYNPGPCPQANTWEQPSINLPAKKDVMGELYSGREVEDGRLIPAGETCYRRVDGGLPSSLAYQSPYPHYRPESMPPREEFQMRPSFFGHHPAPYVMERERQFPAETADYCAYRGYTAPTRDARAPYNFEDPAPVPGVWKERASLYATGSSFPPPINNGHDYFLHREPAAVLQDGRLMSSTTANSPYIQEIEFTDHMNGQHDSPAHLPLDVVAEETVVTSDPTTGVDAQVSVPLPVVEDPTSVVTGIHSSQASERGEASTPELEAPGEQVDTSTNCHTPNSTGNPTPSRSSTAEGRAQRSVWKFLENSTSGACLQNGEMPVTASQPQEETAKKQAAKLQDSAMTSADTESTTTKQHHLSPGASADGLNQASDQATSASKTPPLQDEQLARQRHEEGNNSPKASEISNSEETSPQFRTVGEAITHTGTPCHKTSAMPHSPTIRPRPNTRSRNGRGAGRDKCGAKVIVKSEERGDLSQLTCTRIHHFVSAALSAKPSLDMIVDANSKSCHANGGTLPSGVGSDTQRELSGCV